MGRREGGIIFVVRMRLIDSFFRIVWLRKFMIYVKGGVDCDDFDDYCRFNLVLFLNINFYFISNY